MSTTKANRSPKVTHLTLREMKDQGARISMLTAYDASFARLCDQAGAEILLVGDSLGMVIQGHENTLSVTMDQMIYHCRAVAAGVRNATGRSMVVGDMPFMSYQASLAEAIQNAGRLIKEGEAEAVKLEGGAEHAELISRLSRVGIPVMGHLGLTPQAIHSLGGYRVQGRGDEAATRLLADAQALVEAGCFSIVLECVPRELAKEVTARVPVPIIGIGAGVECDGQVLVLYDLLGMNEEFRPRFVKRYDNLAVRVRTAVDTYIDEVRSGHFPGPEHSFSSEVSSKDRSYGPPGQRVAAAGGVVSESEQPSGVACVPLLPIQGGRND
jgi:3-methyl-2-oxobutanoate hydroxymethyltransferase